MIRQVELSLKFTNTNKRVSLQKFLTEYRRIVQVYIDLTWKTDYYKFIPKKLNVESWISARAKQCAGKQALAIVNGTLKKYKQRCFMRDKLILEGKSVSHINCTEPSKPTIGNIPAELDSRFCDIQNSNNSFDLWLKLSSLGDKIQETIPLRKTKMFNKWCDRGSIKKGIRLTDSSIIIYFDCLPIINKGRDIIGIDIGITSCLSLSNGVQIKECPHGHTLSSINKSLSKRKKGSHGFKRSQKHRTNFINWSVNQLKKYTPKEIVIEKLKNIRKGKNTGRFLSHFTYTEIVKKLELFCEEWDVPITRVNPAYTSQSCSKCGNVQTKNRFKDKFKCLACGFTMNADLNASLNILASL